MPLSKSFPPLHTHGQAAGSSFQDLFALVGPVSLGENGGSLDSLSSLSSSTVTSTSPVAIFLLIVSASRRRTFPIAAITYSERRALAFSCTAGLALLSKTSCVIPLRSRTSIKITLPRSRRRLTQPSKTTCDPVCSGRSSPHMHVRRRSPKKSSGKEVTFLNQAETLIINREKAKPTAEA